MQNSNDNSITPQNMNRRYLIFAGLLIFCLFFKLIPHALGLNQFALFWNFSPLYVICLLMGATCRGGRYSGVVRYLAPLLLLILSDVGIALIGWYAGRKELAFHKVQFAVYGSFLMTIAMGWFLRKDRSALVIGEVGFASAFWFFMITNFAMWALGDGIIYPLNATGLITCYVAALPFFGNTLVAYVVYLPLLFNPRVIGFIEGTTPATDALSQPAPSPLESA